MAGTLAAALAVDETPQLWETAHTTSEQKDVTGSLAKLRATTKQEAIRVVQRLGRNLGHPPATRGANEEILRAAASYVCVACAKYIRNLQKQQPRRFRRQPSSTTSFRLTSSLFGQRGM